MLRFACAWLWVVMSLPVMAALKCEVDLQYGLVVNQRQIRVTEDVHTHYQINDAKQLIVRGEWIDLDKHQEALLHELASGIHYAVPKVIVLASEGVDLAISTVDHVYVGLIGSDNDNYQRLQKALWRVREKVKGKFIRANENFYIGPRSLEDVDEIMDPELEREIEDVLNTSIGGILSAIGGLSSEGDSSIEKRMEELSRRIESMGAEIERRIAPQANSLRKKAEWFCDEMARLDGIEEELRATVPALKPYDLIVTGRAKAKNK